MAPATQVSSTSLIEQPRPLPMVLTRSSGISSFQATTLPTGWPLSAVGESSASAAAHADVVDHLVASTRHLRQTEQRLLRCETSPSTWPRRCRTIPIALIVMSVGAEHGLGQPVFLAPRVRASRAPLGGSLPPSVIDSVTEIKRDAVVADAVVDARASRAAVVVLDQVEGPQRVARVGRGAWQARRRRRSLCPVRIDCPGRSSAPRAPRGARCPEVLVVGPAAPTASHHLLAEAVVPEQLVRVMRSQSAACVIPRQHPERRRSSSG